MNKRRIQLSVILGIIAIAAIISFQYLWFREAFNQEQRKFNQSVHIALLEVVKLLVNDNNSQFPQTNPIEKLSDDYYLVKINDEINAEILEFYLKNEFEKLNIRAGFEYAIYDCKTDEMVYGNYISLKDNLKQPIQKAYFPKIDDLVYYFAVRFPDKPVFFSKPTRTWTIITVISLIVLTIYIYSIFVILRQNRYYELQRDFINSMTHEFKTPLSSIMIASEFFNNSTEIKNNPRLSKYTEAIINQSRRLNGHIERILSLAKSEGKLLSLTIQELDIIPVLMSITENLKLHYDKQIDIQFHHDEGEMIILADKGHFVNVITNLLDNAGKYSKSPVHIRMKAEHISDKIMITVTDEGPGISKKYLKRLFDKFYRVPRENSEQVEGFGLGLYYVKKICDQHKWKIHIKSELNVGTEAQIMIPAK